MATKNERPIDGTTEGSLVRVDFDGGLTLWMTVDERDQLLAAWKERGEWADAAEWLRRRGLL